jgi:Asp-tRNA(Asn)/Glu-tRNA(Gln) amidotransferase A subunit family amidase
LLLLPNTGGDFADGIIAFDGRRLGGTIFCRRRSPSGRLGRSCRRRNASSRTRGLNLRRDSRLPGILSMPNVEPNRLLATEIVRAIEDRTLTAEAVVVSCLGRIAQREPVVRAWAHLAGNSALAAARAFDRAGRRMLLGGVPFGLKDIFDAADMPASYGSPIYTGWRPPADASAAALPKAAGGILLGKTVTTEFANRHPGPTANPHDPAFTPGGSSSGSAAAVADFMVPLAIGTQTGGSVIRPAAYCGVVGFKPSFGLFPPAGMRINTETLDTVGIMARAVADIALFRAAVMAIPYEPPAMPQTPPRLGLCRGPHWDDAEPEGRAVLETAAGRLADAGAQLADTQFPPECAAADAIQETLGAFEALRNHMPELYRHETLLSPALRESKIARGRQLGIDEFRAAWRAAEKARAAASGWAGRFDALLTLPAAGQAPRGLSGTGSAMFNAPWTQWAMPCLTLPAGHGPDGLPVGLQLVGRRHDDARLLEVGLWVERRLGYGDER